MKPGRMLRIMLAAVLLIAPAAAAGREPARLRILYLNDLHGRLLPFRLADRSAPLGGAARLASLLEAERTERSLFLAAGDLMRGAALSDHSRGRAVIEALNEMGLDGSVLGNHDFDYGLDTLRRRAAEARFPFLAANLSGDITGITADRLLIDAEGIAVGVFGLTTTLSPVVTDPVQSGGLKVTSPHESARRAVAALRPEAEVVICLSHLGFEEDLRLAREVPGIDVIVGGHSHTRLDRPLVVGKTVVVQAFEQGLFLGRLDLEIDDHGVRLTGGELLPVDGSAGESGPVRSLIERYRRAADSSPGRATETATGGEP